MNVPKQTVTYAKPLKANKFLESVHSLAPMKKIPGFRLRHEVNMFRFVIMQDARNCTGRNLPNHPASERTMRKIKTSRREKNAH